MERKTKKILVGAGFLTLLGLGWRALRAKAAPPEEAVVGAAVSLEILDMEGSPVPHNSPATVVEGSTYRLRMTVTNKSTRLGVGVGATLGTQPWGAIVSTAMVFTPNWFPQAFTAGQVLVFESTFKIPDGSAGLAGIVGADVFDPNNVLIAQATDPLTVQSAAIIYGATISIGVV